MPVSSPLSLAIGSLLDSVILLLLQREDNAHLVAWSLFSLALLTRSSPGLTKTLGEVNIPRALVRCMVRFPKDDTIQLGCCDLAMAMTDPVPRQLAEDAAYRLKRAGALVGFANAIKLSFESRHIKLRLRCAEVLEVIIRNLAQRTTFRRATPRVFTLLQMVRNDARVSSRVLSDLRDEMNAF